MGQMSLSDFEYSNRKKKTKREEFLEIMDETIPWEEWVGANQTLRNRPQKLPVCQHPTGCPGQRGDLQPD